MKYTNKVQILHLRDSDLENVNAKFYTITVRCFRYVLVMSRLLP